jgi:hypothetical protein
MSAPTQVPASASKISRPPSTDKPSGLSSGADKVEAPALRQNPKASVPVEPDWELVIAAATD